MERPNRLVHVFQHVRCNHVKETSCQVPGVASVSLHHPRGGSTLRLPQLDELRLNVQRACREGASIELVAPSLDVLLSLSFLSQRVEASTSPKCMGSDHSKSECTVTALEPKQDATRSRPAENARQPGPARKRFRRDPGAPQSGTSSSGQYGKVYLLLL